MLKFKPMVISRTITKQSKSHQEAFLKNGNDYANSLATSVIIRLRSAVAYSGERDHRFWFKVITFTRIRTLTHPPYRV